MTFQLKENNQRTVKVSHSNNHHMHRTHSYSEEWMPFDRSPPRWDDYESRNKQVHVQKCMQLISNQRSWHASSRLI